MKAPLVHSLDDAALRAWPLPLPDHEGDKEARGRVVIIAGCRELPGAAILTAEAALRAGAGKVLVATSGSIAVPVAVAVPEARVMALPETAGGEIDADAAALLFDAVGRAGALLIGPGMQDEQATGRLVQALLAGTAPVPTILDAAAIASVGSAPHRPRDSALLVTPHAGEMAHVSDVSKAAIQAGAQGTAYEAALRWNALVALKGACTFLAHPDGRLWRHDAGNIGLATAGSGDVLAGIIVGLAARGAPLEQAAAWGIALHARAGMRLARRLGGMGYFARELAAEVPGLLEGLSATAVGERE